METIVWEEPITYINHRHSVASWLLTYDHKRIGILYLIVVTAAFFLGGIMATLIRLELASPAGDLVSADVYNRMFTMHGVTMVFFVLVPAVPAVLGNFVMPLMIGAKDVAFPKLNLLSWYIFTTGFFFTIISMVVGGVSVTAIATSRSPCAKSRKICSDDGLLTIKLIEGQRRRKRASFSGTREPA